MVNPYLTRFLILTAQTELSPSERKELLALHRQLADHQLILAKLEEEGLVGLAYHHFNAFSNDVNPDFFNLLKNKALVYTARQARIIEQILPLSSFLSRENIRWVVVKGLSLAYRIYPEPYWRPFFDVDMLVHPDDGERVDELLPGFGLEPVMARHLSLASNLAALKKNFWLYRPLYKKKELFLEVHLGFPLLHQEREGEEDFWTSREKFKVQGWELPCLLPEYEFALLCLHLQQHSYSRLIWLTDIVQLIKARQINWDKVKEIAQREHVEGSLAYAISIINQLWPNSVSEDTGPLFSPTKQEKFWLRVFFPLSPILTREEIKESPIHTPSLLQLLGQPRVRTWGRTLKNFFFPPADWVTYYYGFKPWSFKFFRHYLWRLTRPFIFLVKRLFWIRRRKNFNQ
ncbi:MAG: hypothetical protein DRJ06_02385 [Candidatus Aminicenantes bacterium]|nr:MAG: hypothetical protein DRJ06_02385 [Candidatus Aminicenantes bacterium]